MVDSKSCNCRRGRVAVKGRVKRRCITRTRFFVLSIRVVLVRVLGWTRSLASFQTVCTPRRRTLFGSMDSHPNLIKSLTHFNLKVPSDFVWVPPLWVQPYKGERQQTIPQPWQAPRRRVSVVQVIQPFNTRCGEESRRGTKGGTTHELPSHPVNH